MRMALVAAAAALAACSRPAQTTTDEAAPAAGAQRVACAEFRLVGPGEAHCGVGLNADSSLTLDGAPLMGGAPFIVTSGVDRRAQSLMVYPSPQGRYLYVRGCEGPQNEPGLCWASRIIDREGGELRDLTPRSHYGPTREIYWSPDGERFALVEPMESYEALTLVNPASGAIASFPPEGGTDNWRVDDASIRWTSNTALTANVEVCNGDTGVCKPAVAQALTAP
ncbi:MAG: hypothetical protein AB7J28_08825 [Hyphomonadaceae bacterium]